MSDYNELLENAISKRPKEIHSDERFVIPKARVSIQGSKTIIENFNDFVSSLRREGSHVLKFLLKELATKGEITGQRMIVQGVFPESVVNKKIELYVKNFVICPVCKKPDTKLHNEAGVAVLQCEACGARSTAGRI